MADVSDAASEKADKAVDAITGDVDATAKAAQDGALECVSLVNQYDLGQLAGKLFSHFFNSAIEPL